MGTTATEGLSVCLRTCARGYVGKSDARVRKLAAAPESQDLTPQQRNDYNMQQNVMRKRVAPGKERSDKPSEDRGRGGWLSL